MVKMKHTRRKGYSMMHGLGIGNTGERPLAVMIVILLTSIHLDFTLSTTTAHTLGDDRRWRRYQQSAGKW